MAVAKRFGLKYGPKPTLALEYAAADEEDLKLLVVEIPSLTRDMDVEDVFATIAEQHSALFNEQTVSMPQLHRLLGQLVEHAPAAAASAASTSPTHASPLPRISPSGALPPVGGGAAAGSGSPLSAPGRSPLGSAGKLSPKVPPLDSPGTAGATVSPVASPTKARSSPLAPLRGITAPAATGSPADTTSSAVTGSSSTTDVTKSSSDTSPVPAAAANADSGASGGDKRASDGDDISDTFEEESIEESGSLDAYSAGDDDDYF